MNWFYLNEAGEVVGPLSEETLRELHAIGRLAATTQVCREGSEDWITLAGALGTFTANPAGAGEPVVPSVARTVINTLPQSHQTPGSPPTVQHAARQVRFQGGGTTRQATPPRSTGKKWALILGAIGGLAAVIVGIIFVTSKHDRNGGASSPGPVSEKQAPRESSAESHEFWHFRFGSTFSECAETMKKLKNDGTFAELRKGMDGIGWLPGAKTIDGTTSRGGEIDMDGILSIPANAIVLYFIRDALTGIEIQGDLRTSATPNAAEMLANDMGKVFNTKAEFHKEDEVGNKSLFYRLQKGSLSVTTREIKLGPEFKFRSFFRVRIFVKDPRPPASPLFMPKGGDTNQSQKRAITTKTALNPGATDFTDNKWIEATFTEALAVDRLEQRNVDGKPRYFLPNAENPVAGWIKEIDESSKTRTLIHLKSGLRDGSWASFYQNRQLQFRGTYKEGDKRGIQESWYENGQKESERLFDGKVVSVKKWKPNGEVCPETRVEGGNGKEIGYGDDGKPYSMITWKNGEGNFSFVRKQDNDILAAVTRANTDPSRTGKTTATDVKEDVESKPSEQKLDQLVNYYVDIGFSPIEAKQFIDRMGDGRKYDAPKAMMLLAALYEGRNMFDTKECMYWHHKAAEAGSADAMWRLHQILHPGFALAYKGYPKGDAETSFEWARKAAEHGSAEGMNAMGFYCWSGVRDNEGRGMVREPNKKKAVLWWKRAADAGSDEAKKSLKEHHEEILALGGISEDQITSTQKAAGRTKDLVGPHSIDKALPLLKAFQKGTIDEARECIRLLDAQLKQYPGNARIEKVKATITGIFGEEASLTSALNNQLAAENKLQVQMRNLEIASRSSNLTDQVNQDSVRRGQRLVAEAKTEIKSADSTAGASRAKLQELLNFALAELPAPEGPALEPVWRKVAGRNKIPISK